MQRNIVLLTIPPVIALALLFISGTDEQNIAAGQQMENQSNVHGSNSKTKQQGLTLATMIPSSQQTKVEATEATPSSPSTSLSPIDQLRAIKNKTALHQAVIKEHETFTRYPSQNRRFERIERDPVSMTYETHNRTSESDDKASSITAWADQKYMLRGEQVTISARVDSQSTQGIANRMLTEIIVNERQSLGTFSLVDGNRDGTYNFTASSEITQNWPIGIYKALIVSDHKNLSESVSFTVSPPVIRLTGEHRDTLTSNGDLRVDIEIETTESARYYIRASLYSSTNDPIGSAEYSEQLPPGKHWIPLTYFGLMVHDAGEPGPYLLKYVELAQSGVPMLRMPQEKTNIYTQSYALDQFNTQTFAEKDKL